MTQSETNSRFDLIVIGGGPGGYPAAIRASQLGLNTALIESTHLGGICLNWGCVPTKALLHSAEVFHLAQHLEEFGVSAGEPTADIAAMVKRSRRVSKRLTTGVKHLLKKNGVTVFDGYGRLAGPGSVRVESEGAEAIDLSAPNIILSTGARPRSLPGLDADGDRVWTSKEAMLQEVIPGSLLVVGSGAIGMEFASLYSDLGSDVTVVEALPQILPVEDAEISDLIVKNFKKRGMAFHTDSTVTELERAGKGMRAAIQAKAGEEQTIEVDRVMLAVGIVGNVENLGLEGTAVRVDRGHIVTDEWHETGELGVYAIGDVAGPPWLAHKATHEGILAAEHIAGLPNLQPIDPMRIPGCTYCRPQIASIGWTEAQARESGRELKIGRFPFRGNGKAIAMGEYEGMLKTIFDADTGEVLGAHMVGHGVTELIGAVSVAMQLESTEAELMHTVFPHPTLSEALHESVLEAFGHAIHI
ncbi:MAG: dihydrolipoyl dehydrogenase [Deltaproteobacteria bacterium]|nr:dihydrolipoyl dehydrogenase [Deltaproteobacteria bacterium]MBW2723087.1 dihydrolipoyl dehydrogenase [Deltaproteobacteria bacterium]